MDRAETREAWSAPVWFAVYLAWLSVYPEGELAHWLTLVALPLAALRASRGSWRAALESAGLAPGRARRGLGVAALVGLASCGIQLLGRQRAEILELVRSGRAAHLWPASLALMLATAAATEECFFRGVVQPRIAALLRGRIAGVAATAALFGLYHVPYALTVPAWGCEGDLSAALGAAMATGLPLGLVLGWLHERSGRNLLAPILAHAMVNSLPGMLWLESHAGRRG